MGLFGDKKNCAYCSKELGLIKHKFSEGHLCTNCFNECSVFVKRNILSRTLNDIKQDMISQNENKIKLKDFNPTKKFNKLIEFDQDKRQWLVPDGLLGAKVNPKIYSFNDIVEYELLEDGDSVVKGGLGRAIVGGVLFAGVGAVVGAVTGKKKIKKVVNSLMIKITVNDINSPNVFIKILTSKTKTSSFTYKTSSKLAQDILSTLSVIVKQNEVAVADINDNDDFIFCKKCGFKIQSDSIFCCKCGEKLA